MSSLRPGAWRTLLSAILVATTLAACGRYANGSPGANGGSAGDAGNQDSGLSGELTAPPTLAPGQTPTALNQIALLLAGVGERVGENETPFGVRIADLDGQPLAAAINVARAEGVS